MFLTCELSMVRCWPAIAVTSVRGLGNIRRTERERKGERGEEKRRGDKVCGPFGVCCVLLCVCVCMHMYMFFSCVFFV